MCVTVLEGGALARGEVPAELLVGGATAAARGAPVAIEIAELAPYRSLSLLHGALEDALNTGRAVAVALHATHLDATDAAALVADISGNQVGAKRAARCVAAGAWHSAALVASSGSIAYDTLLARLLHYGAKNVFPALKHALALAVWWRPAYDARDARPAYDAGAPGGAPASYACLLYTSPSPRD